MQRFVFMRHRGHHRKGYISISHLLQSFRVGTKPQITLFVGKGRMNLIGKTPVTATQSVIERNQAFFLRIEVRETSSVRMYPKITVYVFMDMKSRTGTFGIAVFDRNLLAGHHSGRGIKMSYNTRFFLFEPHFRRTVYISRKDRLCG